MDTLQSAPKADAAGGFINDPNSSSTNNNTLNQTSAVGSTSPTTTGFYLPASPAGRGKDSIYDYKIPRVFLFGLGPLALFYAVYQAILVHNYPRYPQSPLLLSARQHNMHKVTAKDVNIGPSSRFDSLADEILNHDAQGVKAEKFQSLLSMLETEIDDILKEDAEEAELDDSNLNYVISPKYVHQWGPKVSDDVSSINYPLKGTHKKKILEILETDFLIDEKQINYVGSPEYLSMFPLDDNASKPDRRFVNSLVVAPGVSDERKHGLVGVNKEGIQWYKPAEDPGLCSEKGSGECDARRKKGQGFDLTMSNYKPLDRIPSVSYLNDVCKPYVEGIDITTLDDVSVVITFFNEPISTLLRTIHSVLNNTPPPLLKEIILVDDGSDVEHCLPGNALDEALKYLPKVKILRLPMRKGLVMGRIAGIHNSLGTVALVLDSHVEVNPYWMEPLLERIKENPTSVVMPIIASINVDSLDTNIDSGIGTWLSWRWSIVENATFGAKPTTVDPVPSASMGGGLFAMRRDWFFELGGYDERMTMWGAENVEMPFRVWLCGGRVEGIPCSLTYHIYRKGGNGYSSRNGTVTVNRLRTARLWMGEYYQISRFFVMAGKPFDKEKEEKIIGDMDEMLKLKRDLKCNKFDWFLDNVDPEHDGKNFEDILTFGELRSADKTDECLDTLGNKEKGLVGLYKCHGTGGSQAFYSYRDNHEITLATSPKHCFWRIHDNDKKDANQIMRCAGKDWHHIDFVPTEPDVPYERPAAASADTHHLGQIVFTDKNHKDYGSFCLTRVDEKDTHNLKYLKCEPGNMKQFWYSQKFIKDLAIAAEPTISPNFLAYAD